MGPLIVHEGLTQCGSFPRAADGEHFLASKARFLFLGVTVDIAVYSRGGMVGARLFLRHTALCMNKCLFVW